MENPSSPLDTLRQLKEMLDAGALTPTEFEALKQRLVFNDPAGQTPAAPEPHTAVPPEAAAPPAPAAPAAVPPPLIFELHSPLLDPEPVAVAPAFITPVSVAQPEGAAVVPPEPFPAAFSSEPLARPAAAPEPAVAEFPETEGGPARSPLALILALGGLLVFLAVVVYLSLNRPPSEHISSTSQTAADSVAAPIETGPQAEQLPQAVAAVPETVRVAPANPAPPVPARHAPAVRDSVAVAPPTSAPDSAATQP